MIKVLGVFRVVIEDDGSIRTYNSMKINAPYEISKAMYDYFSKRSKGTVSDE